MTKRAITKPRKDKKQKPAKPQSETMEAVASGALANVDGLQTLKTKLDTVISQLAVINKTSKGRGTPSVDTVLRLAVGLRQHSESILTVAHQMAVEVYGIAAEARAQIQSVTKVLRDKGILTKEEVEEAWQSLVEEAKSLAEKQAAEQAQKAVEEQKTEGGSGRSLPTGEDPEEGPVASNVIQLPR